MVVMTAVLYFVALQLTPVKAAIRYIQPIMAMISFSMTLIFYKLIVETKKYSRKISGIILFLLFVASQTIPLTAVVSAAHADHHKKIFQWLAAQDLRGKIILAEYFTGLSSKELHEEKNYIEKIDNANIINVGWVGRYCSENDCSNLDMIITSCNNFMPYFVATAMFTENGNNIRSVYEKLLAEPQPLFQIGNRDDNFLGKYGLYQGTCVYALTPAALRR